MSNTKTLGKFAFYSSSVELKRAKPSSYRATHKLISFDMKLDDLVWPKIHNLLVRYQLMGKNKEIWKGLYIISTQDEQFSLRIMNGILFSKNLWFFMQQVLGTRIYITFNRVLNMLLRENLVTIDGWSIKLLCFGL